MERTIDKERKREKCMERDRARGREKGKREA